MTVYTCKGCHTPCVLEDGKNTSKPRQCPFNWDGCKWKSREDEDKEVDLSQKTIQELLSECLRRLD